MDYHNLRIFIVTAHWLHFGNAASDLGITQPALSQRISALEKNLAVRLFDRRHKNVTLTAAGRVFLAEAERIIHGMDYARKTAKSMEDGTGGELRIGYSGSVMFEPKLCALLHQYQTKYPNVKLMMQECTVPKQLDGLRKRKFDLALIRGPLNPFYEGIQGWSFLRSRLAIVLHRDHRLASQTQIKIADIKNEAFISLTDSLDIGFGYILHTLFQKEHFSPNIVMQVSSLMSVFGLAGAGLGVGIVPELPIDIISPAFVQRPLIGDNAWNEVLIATPDSSVSATARRFIKNADCIHYN